MPGRNATSVKAASARKPEPDDEAQAARRQEPRRAGAQRELQDDIHVEPVPGIGVARDSHSRQYPMRLELGLRIGRGKELFQAKCHREQDREADGRILASATNFAPGFVPRACVNS